MISLPYVLNSWCELVFAIFSTNFMILHSFINMNSNQEKLRKILVIGDSGVGKTSLIRMAVHNTYSKSMKATVGVDFALKIMQYNNIPVTLQLWDIAGNERSGKMTRVYFKGATGCFIVCDGTNSKWPETVIEWKSELDSKVMLGSSGKPIPCVLLLNKSDLENCQSTDNEIENFCKENQITNWFHTSAKTGEGIDQSFTALINKVEDILSEQTQPEIINKKQNILKHTESAKDKNNRKCSC